MSFLTHLKAPLIICTDPVSQCIRISFLLVESWLLCLIPAEFRIVRHKIISYFVMKQSNPVERLLNAEVKFVHDNSHKVMSIITAALSGEDFGSA